MLNRRIVAGLAALSAVAAVNMLAACTPSDDNDVFPTPTPEEPPPVTSTFCQIVWTSQNADGSVDAFAIDGAEDAWKVGGDQFFSTLDTAGAFTGDGFTGLYQPAAAIDGAVMDITSFDDTGAFAVGDTAGTVNFSTIVTFNGTADGADITATLESSTPLLGIGTDGALSGDTVGEIQDFSFTGFWSAKGSDTPDLDPGSTVTLNLSTNLSNPFADNVFDLGDFGSWAICYDVEQ